MQHIVTVARAFLMLAVLSAATTAQTYVGNQTCKLCHSAIHAEWSKSLHNRIHQLPDSITIRPESSFKNDDSVSLGTSVGDAKVYLSKVGSEYFATVGAGGSTYKIAWTYGWGYKQRYLTRIGNSYYILPIQYNLKGYVDNSTGTWAAYNAGNWFTPAGTPKPIDNAFRTKSWDKNCLGCHVTGGRSDREIVGSDTSWASSWVNSSTSPEQDIVVGCESCHGPYQGGAGAGHQMNPSKLGSRRTKMEVCGQCHNRATAVNGMGTVGTHEFPKDEPGNAYFNPADTTKPLALFLNTSIQPNKSGGRGTWPDTLAARQHHQQYHDMLASKHYTNPFVEMTCWTCHDPHKAPGDKQLRDSLYVGTDGFKVSDSDNTLCLSCHATHGPFATIQKAWVQDPVGFKDSIGSVVNAHTRHALYDPDNALSSGGGGRCTKCHMTKTAVTARSYDISGHTWGVVDPGKTITYAGVTSPTLGMLNSCAVSCHRNPSGATASVPTFGIATDATLTNWAEATDLELADTLYRYWTLWGLPTSVKTLAGQQIPTSFTLSQNYPNPFNPSTRIAVDVPARGDVRLVVYSVLGEEVVRLMNGTYEAGRYEVTWNGRDAYGTTLASGMYLYRLESGDQSRTKKMLLMK